MWDFVKSLITPALVSLGISLWAGRFQEAQRARRDHWTKLFELAREDVRRAADAAIDYHSTEPSARTPLQEAKVLAADRELRAVISPLVVVPPGPPPQALVAASAAFVDLIGELTGGNFQEAIGDVDREHLKRLVFSCASMRSSLADVRRHQLKAMVDADPIMSRLVRARDYWQANNPFRNNP